MGDELASPFAGVRAVFERADLFAELRARDYKTIGRTKQNVMLELMPDIS